MTLTRPFSRQDVSSPTQAATVLERVAPIAVGLVLLLLPMVFPLGIGGDYPNHLALVYIQTHLDSEPALAGNYVLDRFLVPHLAMDLLAVPLAAVLSPYAIGALFNGLVLVLLFSAAIALYRQGGGKDFIWPLLATAVLFNESLHWGFMNFLFACGMALWILYFWLASEEWPPARRLVLFSLAQIALFLAHLLGFLLAGYLILVLEAVRFWRAKDRRFRLRCGAFAFAMLQFAVPLAMLGYVLFNQGGVGNDQTLYGTAAAKLRAFFSPTSALPFPFSFLALSGIVLLLYAVLRYRLADLDRKLLPLLPALAVLCIVMPNMVLGIWGMDLRYAFVALLLAIVAVRLRPAVRGGHWVRLAAMAVAALALASGAFQFSENDRRQQEVRRALALAEPGGALLVAGDYDPDCPKCLPAWADLLHAGSLAAIERQMFVPLLLTGTSPVAAASARHDLDVPDGGPVSRQQLLSGRQAQLPKRGPAHDPRHPYWYSWDRNFDYLLWMRTGDQSLDDVAGLERIASGEVFDLYWILKPSQRPDA